MPTRRDFLKHSATTGVAAAAFPFLQSGSAAASGAIHDSDSGHPPSNFAEQLNAARIESKVTGASFAYWDCKSLHTAVSGMRNSVTGDPVTLDTLMHVGSITKLMNTTLMMQLVDEGKIALDDPIEKHLPEFRLRDLRALKHITCEMLVNHTSGINGDWLPEYGPDKERIVDTINRCADLNQLYPPGQETSYCNVATVVAGYLAQKIRDTSWYTLIRTHIYEPLGMQSALVDPLEVPRFRVSVGDLTDAESGKLVQTTRPFLAPSFAPAGSTQMTTAVDLILFARAMLNDGVGANGVRILSAASARRMMEPTATFAAFGSAPATKVGLGWMILPGGLLGHGGGGPGVRSQLYVHPASGKAATLLTNCDKGDVLQAAFMDPLTESWTGIKSVEPQRQSGPIDPTPYVGVYENNVERYIISAREGELALQTQDTIDTFDNFTGKESPAASLYPVGNDSFEGKATTPSGSRLAISFIRPNASGQMRFLSSWGRLLVRVN